MPSDSESGDDGLDSESYGDDLEGGEGTDFRDDPELLADVLADDLEGDRPGRGFDVGPGLTESERELADERNRIRELESARDRFERFAGDGELGSGGRTGSPADRDALAIVEAAERFGVDEDDEQANAELESIAEALSIQAKALPKRLSEYEFYGIIGSVATRGTNIVLTMKIPWEFREEVWRAADTMPFAATIKMTEVSGLG